MFNATNNLHGRASLTTFCRVTKHPNNDEDYSWDLEQLGNGFCMLKSALYQNI